MITEDGACGRMRTAAVATLAVLAALPAQAQIGTTSPPVESITVTTQRLDAARAAIETQTGASTYTIDAKALEAAPGGANTPLNQVILQAPGVAQDSFGQLHIRGDHNGLQYRLNGTVLPEGLSGFGQILSPRLIASLKLITGVLPAEYGLHTAGIVDLATKSGGLDPGGSLAIYAGSHGTIEPSFNVGGAAGSISYFLSGDGVWSDLGIESPDGRATPLHDRTRQYHGFAYLDDVVNDRNRVSVALGTSHGTFQIPNQSGQQPGLGLTVTGQSSYPSENLNENQREVTHFGIASLQHSEGALDLNTALIARFSSLNFSPDPVGDLLYDGIAQSADKRDLSLALQTDAAYRAGAAHTLRAGFYLQRDRATTRTLSAVLLTDPAGRPLSDQPVTIADDGGKTQWIESVYLQDEFHPADRLTINAGLRYDHVSAYVSAHQFSPRLNVLWNATNTTDVHIGYARYFSPPPFELVGTETVAKFVGTTNAPNGLLNDAVRAERAHYFDAGVEQKIGKAVTLGLDTYYRTTRDLLDEGQFGAPIILTPFNYASGRSYGLESTLNVVSGPLTAYANFALEQARGTQIVSSQFNFTAAERAYIDEHFIDLDHAQHVSASAGVSYVWEGTRFSADMLFGSGLRAELIRPDGTIVPNGAHLPGYVVVNVGVQHTFPLAGKSGLQARFDVVNIADRRYAIRNGTGVGVGAPQFGARRGLFGGLALLF